jgi:prepilin-type N-terminal cleavage/methylation domain-containing protein
MNQRRTAMAVPSSCAPTHRPGTAAFTLIEMSIVLVIIGLIVGGVLVGQELIIASTVRAQISQLEKFTAAVYAFRGKYDCLPGDCINATLLGLGTPGGPGDNGNGDGSIAYTSAPPCFIGGTSNGGTGYAEALNFWYHLQQAQMVEGSYVGYAGEFPDFTQIGKPQGTMPAAKLGTVTIIIPTAFGCPGPNNQRTSLLNGFWLWAFATFNIWRW